MRRRRGYILVVTLGLLVLAATLLVSIGRAAVDHALAARRQEAELQQRWAVISARMAILTNADETLARLEQDLHRPLPEYRASIQLNGQRLDLMLSDEQAKANVNALIFSAGKGSAETRIRNALLGSGLTNAVRLRPAEPPLISANNNPLWIGGFGQILDNVAPAQLIDTPGTSPAATLTCWGSGAMNLMRASRASLQLFAGPAMNDLTIARLIKERDAAFAPLDVARSNFKPRAGDEKPIAKSSDAVTSLLNRAKVDPRVRNQVGFVSGSQCHSLWVISHDNERTRHYLFVSDQSDDFSRQIRAFEW